MRAPMALRLALTLLVSAAGATSVRAGQDAGTDDTPQAGPVSLSPRLAITNVGMDSNIFNEPADPKSDTTATISPSLDASLRLGPGRLTAQGGVDYLYFRQYTNQRALNWTTGARFALRIASLTPFVHGSFASVRERPSLEIDVRARRQQTTTGGGVDLALGPKTTVRAGVTQVRTVFEEDAEFLGVNLHDSLTGTSRDGTLAVTVRLSPFTQVSLSGGVQEDRFDFSPERDSQSVRVMTGVEFAPSALVSGEAQVGIRQFDIATPGVEDFSGLVASVNLTYRLRERTRIGVGAHRDVANSFSVLEPYFLLTGVDVLVGQRIGERWELLVSGGRQRFSFRRSDGSAVPAGESTTEGAGVLDMIGGGIGYFVGRNLRVGMQADAVHRRGGARSTYRGLRVYSTITYGR